MGEKDAEILDQLCSLGFLLFLPFPFLMECPELENPFVWSCIEAAWKVKAQQQGAAEHWC